MAGADLRSLTQPELARRVGVVLTERVLVEGLSARRVIELGRYPHSGWFGALDARDREVVERAIDAVSTRHLVDRDFGRLSDGERQRVMIARERWRRNRRCCCSTNRRRSSTRRPGRS